MAGIPYAPSRLYQSDSSIAEMILQAGNQQAQGQRAGGQIWGGALRDIGQNVAGAVQDFSAQKQAKAAMAAKLAADAPRLAQEAELRGLNIDKAKRESAKAVTEEERAAKVAQLFSGEKPPSSTAIMSIFSDEPERGFAMVKGLAALEPDSEKRIARYKDTHVLFRDAIGGLAATPEPLKPQAWTMARNGLIAKGLITEEDVPAEWSKEAETVAMNFGRAPEKHQGFSLTPGEVRFDENGKKIASVAPKPVAPEKPSYQSKDILDDSGKPVVANYNSHTGEYFSPDGTKIKNPKPVPSDRVSQDQNKFKKAAPVLSAIGELSEKINTGSGLLAKMAGGAEKLAAKANYDDDVAEYQSLVSGFTPMVARALGHTGVLTQQDVDSVKALFPLPGDSKTLRDRKVDRIKNIITELEGVGAGGADLAAPKAHASDGGWTVINGIKVRQKP